jgi:acyl-ACP thioesterase
MFVERRPACGETVQISTWPREWEKLFALRDYEIRDEKGNAVVRGRGCWLVIDVERRRPLRIQPFLEPLPPNRGIDAFPAGPSGLNAQENPVKKTERSALYSDIDYYGHVNNARYIQWIQDATNPDVLIKADQARLDINYLSEVLPGETIEIWTAAIEDSASMENRNPADYPGKFGPAFAYEGRRSGTGQAVFRSELRT